MNTTTLTKLSMNVLNANKLVNYLLDENINLSGTIMLGLLGSLEMYKNIIETQVEDNSIVYIFDTKLVNFYTKNIYIKNIQIYTVNIKEDDFEDFAVKLKNMPKFDFIIQNPPYNKTLHLDFFNKGLDLLSDTGKMVIIEPSTWLIELRQNIAEKKSSQMKKYIALKERINGHVSKVIIENFNIEFRTDNYMPFAITYIDNSKEYKQIKYLNFGIDKYVNSLYDCNLVGNIEIIKGIFEKIKNYDVVNNHIYVPCKSKKIESNYYCKIAGIISGSGSQLCALFDPLRSSLSSIELNNIAKNTNFNDDSNIMFENNGIRKHLQVYSTTLFHRYKNSILSVPLHKYDRGKHETDKEAECVTGTKQELENWKYYVFNNSLPLFINICLTIDQHNNSLPYVPWLVDKQYTDEEIYEMFGFTEEEIRLIETTIKKYERYSPWFKRYMCGPSSVSDEEVQKFINEL